MRRDPSTRRRSIAKGLSFEVLSNLVGGWLAYEWFGDITSCVVFTFACFLVKLVLFYYHERIWHQIPYGKQP
jgi:uncharacterized membrane protein